MRTSDLRKLHIELSYSVSNKNETTLGKFIRIRGWSLEVRVDVEVNGDHGLHGLRTHGHLLYNNVFLII